MAIDQRLMMGIIFIIAGVALALLAYAAFLYRRAPAELEEGVEAPGSDGDVTHEDGQGGEEVDAPETTSEHVTEPAEVETEAQAETDAGAAAEMPESQAEPDEVVEDAAEPDEGSDELELDQEPVEEAPVEDDPGVGAWSVPTTPVVNLSQDPVTGRLVVEVDGRTFSSAQDLRDSEEWKQVGPILRDTVAWLTLADSRQDKAQEPRESGMLEAGLPSTLSMVEQINLILERKLERGEISTRAVRLVEGADGSIRVYIGVNSYSIDEVPDDEVERLIHEAVAEWESHQ